MTATIEAKIDEVLAAVRRQAETIEALAALNTEKTAMLKRAGDCLQAGLEREAMLTAAVNAMQAHEVYYRAAIESALHYLRNAPPYPASTDEVSRLISALERSLE